MKPCVLLVEDDPAVADSIRMHLQREGYDILSFDRAENALDALNRERVSVLITDIKLPGISGFDLLLRVREERPRLPVLVITAHGTTDTAIEATKRGAYDYLVKPFDPEELVELVSVASESSEAMSEQVALGEKDAPGPALVGRSRVMQNLCKEIGRIAPTSVPVLILGETGTGKELVARAIYDHSQRAGRPFLAINAAALPESLLESELFGHERGAFTGAERRRVGRFQQADGGTLYLDEIGDLPLVTQAKLLRVLQDGTFQMVGGTEELRVNVRLITATHRDLEEIVARGEGFREDLFFRLSGAILRVPPLRDRPEDIPELVQHFVRRHSTDAGVTDPMIRTDAIRWLQSQPWPGNVRQLENTIRQALVLARPLVVGVEHVQRAVTTATSAPGIRDHSRKYIADLLDQARRGIVTNAHARMVSELEAELFSQAIELAGGNQAQVARWLGVTRLKVREKLRELGLRPGTSSESEGGT